MPPGRGSVKTVFSAQDVNELLLEQAVGAHSKLGVVLYYPPVKPGKEFSQEDVDKVLYLHRRKCASLDDEAKPSYSALELNSVLEEQAQALQNALDQPVSFTPVDKGRYSRAQAKELLQLQQKRHMEVFRRRYPAPDESAYPYRELFAFMLKVAP